VDLAHLMRVLVVNAGSSTLKLRLLGPGDEVEASADLDPWDGGAGPAVERVVSELGTADAVGHRVVHGGEHHDRPVVIDDAVRATIAELAPLAPLHQPRAVAAIDAVGELLDRPAVACFDTGYHATLPAAARTYALPGRWRQRWPLRRFGFHGLSHRYASRRAAELVGRPVDDLRIVTCHLGAGASLCAHAGGRSVDTTMGFTPLEGLVMATRSGSVDPGLLLWLLEHGGIDVADLADGLTHASGLAGLAGGSGDMREVAGRIEAGDGDARLAFDVYSHRLRREIGAMAATLGGLDVLAFTGGVGEHHPAVRAAAAEGLGHLGVALDDAANGAASTDADVSAPDAAARTVVVTAREDVEIARQVRLLLG
jgi:acetate kinase